MQPARHPRFNQAAALIDAGRVAEGALILSQLAAAGDVLSINTLAELKWSGRFAPDPVAARTLFERAAAAGYVPAAIRVTNLTASGIAGPRDWPRALHRLKVEAARFPARAQALALLGRMKIDAHGDPVALPVPEPLSESPRVTLFRNLFTPEECAYVRSVNEGEFRPALVFDSQRRLVRNVIRTSDEATINWMIEDPAVHALNRRLAAVSGTAPEQGEAVQVLRYQPGQEYRAHYDSQPGAANQRVLTALVYLNDDYEGGETAFVRTGLKVRAARGDAIVFANTLPDGRRDEASEHAGLPVTRGTKYLLSRWIRARRWAP